MSHARPELEGRMSTARTADFLARVQWRNLAGMLSLLLILAAIIWVTIAPQYWTSCLILVGSAYPLAIMNVGSSR